MTPELIYCSAGDKRFARIAIDAGFTYGAQMPNKVYFTPEFVDQNWKNPNLKKYLLALKQHRPRIATVLDLETKEQFTTVILWAVFVSLYVSDAIIIIPKVHGIIKHIPRQICGKQIRLGYSVPTKYGGTNVMVNEFIGWPVHLLGGSPKNQKELSYYLDVVSLDSNYARMKAREYCQYFDGKRWVPDGGKTKNDAHYKCFEISCANIKKMWND